MSRITGHRCDNQGCPSVIEDDKLAPGWLVVRPIVELPQRVEDVELCSNRCLRAWGLARYRGEVELNPSANGSGAWQKNTPQARAAHRRYHANPGTPNPDCIFCQEETAPVGG